LKQSKANSANGVEESRIMRQGSSGTWHRVLHMLVVLVVSLSVLPVPRTGRVYVVYVFLCCLCLCLCWWFDMVWNTTPTMTTTHVFVRCRAAANPLRQRSESISGLDSVPMHRWDALLGSSTSSPLQVNTLHAILLLLLLLLLHVIY